MLTESRFFNSENRDRVYEAEDFAEYFRSFIGNGIIPLNRDKKTYLDGFKITSTEGMVLNIAKGNAIINGYYVKTLNSEDVNLKIDVANTTDRIDRVILRLDYEKRVIDLSVLKGNESIEASPKDLVRNDDYYDLCLAEVRVRANTSDIVASDIKDTRADEELCGWCELNINTPAIGKSHGVPGGTIIAWYPRKDADGQYKIPDGWVICDGENGTPNLVDRFIMGSGLDNAGTIGGSNYARIEEENLPPHSHTGLAELSGGHTHKITGGSSTNYGYTVTIAGREGASGNVDETELGGYHSHKLKIDKTGEGKPFLVRPAFYTLVYLMKL